MIDWVLTRVSHPQGGDTVGIGSGGIGGELLPISGIEFDISTGIATFHWEVSAVGEHFVIYGSEDLENWSEMGVVISSSTGIVSFQYDTSASVSTAQFFRILLPVS